MSRYPFRVAVNRYMAAYDGVYAESTYKELDRRFRRIGRILSDLRSSGSISTCDPSNFTPEDIKSFAVALRRTGMSPGALQHDVGTLGVLCLFCGNDCVRLARAKYPAAFPMYRKSRGTVLEEEEFAAIIRYAGTCSGSDLRDAASVCFALGTGARPCEMREARVDDLDLVAGTLYIRRPKGNDSYGTRRTVPVRPEVRGILSLYIRSEELCPEDLIFSVNGAVVSSNSLGVWRSKVCEACGVQFDFRKLRRTYGQYLLDEGFSLDDVSVLLGHTNVMTTNTFYAGARPSRVVQNVLTGWDSKKDPDEKDSDAGSMLAVAGMEVQGKDCSASILSDPFDFLILSGCFNSVLSVGNGPLYPDRAFPRDSGLIPFPDSQSGSGFAGSSSLSFYYNEWPGVVVSRDP